MVGFSFGIGRYDLIQVGKPFSAFFWIPKNLRRIEVPCKWPKLPELVDFSRFQRAALQTEDGADRLSVHKRQAGYRAVDLCEK